MTECEICGKEATQKVVIDGIILDVCDECAKFGKPISLTLKKQKRKTKEIPESSKYIDSNYPKILKKAREKMKLKIKEVAKKLNEKESIIARIERGDLTPPLNLARKLERFFGVKLILDSE